MSDPAVAQVVEEKTQAGELFTAHDVTLEVRNRGHFLKHNDGKEIVHDLYSRGEMGVAYIRTQISVPTGQPWLYHRSADDPSQYQNVRGTASAPVVASPVNTPPSSNGSSQTISVPSFDDDDDDDSDTTGASTTPKKLPVARPTFLTGGNSSTNGNGKSTNSNAGRTENRTVDGRKTLSLPTPLLKKVGFNPGATAYVVAGQDQLEVHTQQPSSPLTRYTVDCNNQVRITQATLEKAGIGGDSYDVKDDGDKVIVKLHN